MSVQSKEAPSVALTDGLIRNTFFNSMGLAWFTLLAFVSTPYVVHGLGVEAYGLFGIVSLVAGYAGLFNSPMATGSVRFMAQAYARKDWSAFKTAAIAGVILNGGLALVGTLIILLMAAPLTHLFTVTGDMMPQMVTAFQLAAFSFFFSSIVGALQSILTAIRRYDIVNGARIGLSTLRILAMLGAIHWGYGFVGVTAAQVFTNLVGIVLFIGIARIYLNKISGNATEKRWPANALKGSIRQLFTFSVALFIQQIAATVSQQIDKTAIGLFLSASQLTFYTVPLQLGDRISQLIAALTATLYPLSSEAMGNERLSELRRLYLSSVCLLVWIAAFLATLIVAGAQDFLLLWVGPEFADKSWFVLAILAIAAIWRTPSTVAFQVYNGLGRVDMGIRFAWLYFFALTVAVFALTPKWGINGTAMAILITTVPTALYADILTQRKLLGQTDWSLILLPYVKPWLVGSLLILGLAAMPDRGSWLNLGLRGVVISSGFAAGLLLLDRPILATMWAKMRKFPLTVDQQRI